MSVPAKFKDFKINEPKQRIIQAPKFDDAEVRRIITRGACIKPHCGFFIHKDIWGTCPFPLITITPPGYSYRETEKKKGAAE